MQIKSFTLCLAGLVSLATAAEMDAPAVKNALKSIDAGVVSLDSAIKAITTANAATQVDVVISKMTAFNQILVDASPKLKSSKPLGLLDLTGLTTPLTSVTKTVTSLMDDLVAKRTIIVKAGQADKLGQALKKSGNGFGVFQEAVMAQLPTSLTSSIPKGTATLPAGITQASVDKASDFLFDVSLAIFKGADTTVKVPAAVIWPLATKKRSVQFRA
jgi:hypothetical protein